MTLGSWDVILEYQSFSAMRWNTAVTLLLKYNVMPVDNMFAAWQLRIKSDFSGACH
jgi:hypothetical protein